MGLASSTIQRAASEIIRFPSTKTTEKSTNGEHGANPPSDHQTASPTTLREAPVEGEAGWEGSAALKDSYRSNNGPDKSTPNRRHGGLSRSLADRIESPEFTPFGGATVREQPALVPVPFEPIMPAVPFDADFMVCGTTGVATKDESSDKPQACTDGTPFVRKSCDFCVRKKQSCNGNRECVRFSVRNRKDAPRGVDLPELTGRESSQHERRDEEVMPPRCRREDCPEPPLHGRRGGRPLWCQLHFISQNSHQPLRCTVLQRTVSGNFLACWKDTTWGWPGKAPTRCEPHKAEGQQRLDFVNVVSLLRGVFAQVLWPELLERGWREERVHCKFPYSLWMPPNVCRGTKDFKARVDYFDTVPQVIKYCLRTEEHHGWIMMVYQQLAKLPTPVRQAEVGNVSRKSSSCALPRRTAGISTTAAGKLQPVMDGKGTSYSSDSSPRHGAAFAQQAMHPSPVTTEGFSHQLFSVTPSPGRAEHDGNGHGNGISSVADSFHLADSETWPPGMSTHIRLPHSLAYRSHRAARLRAQGLNPALVTRMGLACSQEVLAGCLARMSGGGRNVGGSMAALAASLRGFGEPVSGQEHAAAATSSSSPKLRRSEISDSDMHYMGSGRSRELAQRSRDLAQGARNNQSSIASQTQDGEIEKVMYGTAADAQRQQEGLTVHQDGNAEANHALPKLSEEEEALSGAEEQLIRDASASYVPTTAGKEPNGDPGLANDGQDKARDVALVPSSKRKACCLSEAPLTKYPSKARCNGGPCRYPSD